MYGDFSRVTYSPSKHYTAVWSQQGRVQLDADANEQTSIFLEWLRTLAIDFIGPFGGHVTRSGFQVSVEGDHLTLSPGHYYVHGLRCELTRPAHEAAAAFRIPKSDLLDPPYLVQLLVWERSVSAAAAPELLEPGLGPQPPDTTVRTQIAWVPIVTRTLPALAGDDAQLSQLDDAQLTTEALTARFERYNWGTRHRPLLAAKAERVVETVEQTIVPTSSGYLGVENQLYRVEIHDGSAGHSHGHLTKTGASGPTFKWSRDNGSVEFAIVGADADSTQVTVASLGRDGSTRLEVNDWVEFIDNRWAPFGTAPPLRTVRGIDPVGRVVTLDSEVHVEMARHPFLRRWDQPAGSGGVRGIPIPTESPDDGHDHWIELEDGVQVRFASDGAEYRRGDYWLIPARTATGNVLWPGGSEPRAMPPAGPDRFLAPLALVTADRLDDLRILFTHLAWPDAGAPAGNVAGPGV